MAERAKCEICNREFKDIAGLMMHNATKHQENVIPSKEKSQAIWVYSGLVIFAIMVVFVLYTKYSGGISFLNSNAINSNTASEDVQKIIIGMKNYNYYPNTIKLKSGIPVEITLDNSVGGCFRSFNIRELGVSYRSSDPSDKIKFTPTKKGSFEFACGMRMAYGTIIVK